MHMQISQMSASLYWCFIPPCESSQWPSQNVCFSPRARHAFAEKFVGRPPFLVVQARVVPRHSITPYRTVSNHRCVHEGGLGMGGGKAAGPAEWAVHSGTTVPRAAQRARGVVRLSSPSQPLTLLSLLLLLPPCCCCRFVSAPPAMRLAFVTLALVALAALAVSATAVDLETEAPGQTTSSQSEERAANERTSERASGTNGSAENRASDQHSAHATDTIAGSWMHQRAAVRRTTSAGQSAGTVRRRHPIGRCLAAASQRWLADWLAVAAAGCTQRRHHECSCEEWSCDHRCRLLASLRGQRCPVPGIARSRLFALCISF